MISDQQAKRMALFFYLSLGNETIALRAAEKAVGRFRTGHSDTEEALLTEPVRLIRVCQQQWDRSKKQLRKVRSSQAFHAAETKWQPPANLDLSIWGRFRKDANEDEMLAVIFSRVLGFSEEEIATALDVSLGTIRHRVARAIRQLGTYSIARA